MFFIHWELQKPQLFFGFGFGFCCVPFEREGYDLTELDCNIFIDLQKTCHFNTGFQNFNSVFHHLKQSKIRIATHKSVAIPSLKPQKSQFH